LDSRLAADPVARHILDLLTILEKAAGVRAHYRILDSPPLVSVEASSINTVARVLSDWIGLRNAIFNINIVDQDQPAQLVRMDPDQEEFSLELPASALASPECALAVLSRQVARAYLVTSNIGGGSVDPMRTGGSMADVTAIFLGMGKMLLNAPAAGVAAPQGRTGAVENQSLSPEYLAFTHRLVCSMRGLDWSQHTSGLSQSAVNLLRSWDGYRDTVFSQALRNVLTASASHRPLMDAVEDNHLALARFNQLQRLFEATVLRPLEKELESYHQTCREGMERLAAREQDTYDPCLLYLNQLRRRMDLQRYADMLLLQQDHVLNRLRVLTAGLSDLNARKLVHTEGAETLMDSTHCPFDGTLISIHDHNQDSRVRCPTCGYSFLASSGLPQISAIQPPDETSLPEAAGENVNASAGIKSQPQPKEKAKPRKSEPAAVGGRQKKSRAATWIIWGIVLMPLVWLPMLGYVGMQLLNGQDAPLVGTLGKIGIVGSVIALVILLIGIMMALLKWLRRRNPVMAAGAD
jgi:hypothetical protein